MSGHVDTALPSVFSIGRFCATGDIFLPFYLRPSSGQDIFHCLALILGKLLIEVPVGEQASLDGRDGSGDAAFGNGHLLLIEAGYVASQGYLPMLEDFVEAIIGLLQVLAIDLEGRLIYHCRAGPVRVEPNPFHIVASRDPFGSATVSIFCLYWATWSPGSVVPSYAFMLGKENFLRILIKVILSVKGVSVYESGLLFRMGGATPGSLSTCAKGLAPP
ncbi:hypothetical protein F2Q70_00002727 [Brassica cretica]|uniref:Uncharacterized protein n=1 Tax=Brassica cretica TaxID=69181 RepID=A0A8S9INW9_BRACR|nr:hypothetical protein F2Q70_00002727 [Brassica cretica]